MYNFHIRQFAFELHHLYSSTLIYNSELSVKLTREGVTMVTCKTDVTFAIRYYWIELYWPTSVGDGAECLALQPDAVK